MLNTFFLLENLSLKKKTGIIFFFSDILGELLLTFAEMIFYLIC